MFGTNELKEKLIILSRYINHTEGRSENVDFLDWVGYGLGEIYSKNNFKGSNFDCLVDNEEL